VEGVELAGAAECHDQEKGAERACGWEKFVYMRALALLIAKS